jgi:hypothetical protein
MAAKLKIEKGGMKFKNNPNRRTQFWKRTIQ